jgi:hypothetical protein
MPITEYDEHTVEIVPNVGNNSRVIKVPGTQLASLYEYRFHAYLLSFVGRSARWGVEPHLRPSGLVYHIY